MTSSPGPGNILPVAVTDTIMIADMIAEDTVVPIPVLANDIHVDGDALRLAGFTQLDNGSVALTSNGACL